MVDFNILIFNAFKGKKLKEYEILEETENNLYRSKNINIKKWNNINDNEFIMTEGENIFLFELNENENSQKDIELKIIGYYYLLEKNELIKLDEENRFYINKNDHILIEKFLAMETKDFKNFQIL